MKLVVGLGNPGGRYAQTRHNVGFLVAARLAERYGQGRPRSRFNGELVEAQVESVRVLLLCPQTYMNNSGRSVQAASSFFKLEHQDVLIVCDDFNLPVARLRFRAKGSSGGQKGLRDIIQRLGTDQFSRLRIGIGPPSEGWDVADFVLSKFRADELPLIDEAVSRATQAVADWVVHGIQHCMNRYNAN